MFPQFKITGLAIGTSLEFSAIYYIIILSDNRFINSRAEIVEEKIP